MIKFKKCSICFNIMFLSYSFSICKHKFHKKCLMDWLSIQNNCPICREVYLRKSIRNIHEKIY